MKKVVIAATALAVSIISVGTMAIFAMTSRPAKNVRNISSGNVCFWKNTQNEPAKKAVAEAKPVKKAAANNVTNTAVKTPVKTADKPAAKKAALKPGTIVGSENEGFSYVNDRGVIDKGFCGSVEVNGESWNVINGKATKSVTESDKMLGYALKALAKCTNSSMSKEEKLKAAFKYLQDNYLEGVVRDDYRGVDWPTVYANDLLVKGKGDCFSFGAAFAYMAKGIGYTECYACNSGGHGWAEVNGKLYDPEWSKHSSKYSYFGMSYDEECDVPYKNALGDADWMHVKV